MLRRPRSKDGRCEKPAWWHDKSFAGRLRRGVLGVALFASVFSIGTFIVTEIDLRRNAAIHGEPGHAMGFTARLKLPVVRIFDFVARAWRDDLRIATKLVEEPQCFGELTRQHGVSDARHDAISASTIFLLVRYDDGRLRQGSGVVIEDDDGPGRILTAAHVVAPSIPVVGVDRTLAESTSMDASLESVRAYDADGRDLGVVDLTYSAAPDFHDPQAGYRGVGDVAVLEWPDDPLHDPGGALALATHVPDNMMLLEQHSGLEITNEGISGGPVVNDSGEVIGVVIQTAHAPGRPRSQAPLSAFATNFIEQVEETGIDPDFEAILPALERRLYSPGRVTTDTAIGLPAHAASLRAALGHDESRKMNGFLHDVIVAGYPGYECRAARMESFQMPLLPLPELDMDAVIES